LLAGLKAGLSFGDDDDGDDDDQQQQQESKCKIEFLFRIVFSSFFFSRHSYYI
jgi:hypothetical protein